MKSIIAFWKHDIINKLIVIVLFVLLFGVGAIAWLIFNMPQGKSLREAFVDVLPQASTPTFDVNAYLPTRAPTIIASTPFILSSLTPQLPTATLVSPAPDLAISTPKPAETARQYSSAQNACIPGNAPETGRVVEIIDGNTIKVLMYEKVYIVRYIGIKVPRDDEIKEPFGPAATHANSQLVYRKDVILFRDVSDKDDRGRLLRYVMVGEMFVNVELLRQGYGLAEEIHPDIACAGVFVPIEQEARQSLAGQWISTPAP